MMMMMIDDEVLLAPAADLADPAAKRVLLYCIPVV